MRQRSCPRILSIIGRPSFAHISIPGTKLKTGVSSDSVLIIIVRNLIPPLRQANADNRSRPTPIEILRPGVTSIATTAIVAATKVAGSRGGDPCLMNRRGLRSLSYCFGRSSRICSRNPHRRAGKTQSKGLFLFRGCTYSAASG